MEGEPEKGIKTATSFRHEHGIFLSEDILTKYNLKIGEPAAFNIGDYRMVEVCARLGKISDDAIESEARSLLSIFEAMEYGSFSFLSMYGMSKRFGGIKQAIPILGDIYPEFRINETGTFCCLYREVEDLLFEYGKEEDKRSKDLGDKVDNTVTALSKYLKSYYEGIDCVVGNGAFLSRCPLNLDIAYALQGFNGGRYSEIGEEGLHVNPYLMYWLISDITEFEKKSLKFTNNEMYDLKPVDLRKVRTIKSLKCRVFVSITDIDPSSRVHREQIDGRIRSVLSFEKPYLYPADFITPFTSPAIVIFEEEEGGDRWLLSSYGDYVSRGFPARVEKSTEIHIEFFDFPLHNKNVPVILDTSAIDASRFPISLAGPFYEIFLEDREIIIPKSALWEVKKRLKTEDGKRVEKVLKQLQDLKSWRAIRKLEISGGFPQFFISEERIKEQYGDFIDCLILDVAIKNNGILYTNDADLQKMAILSGVFAVAFEGMEQDVCTVIGGNDFQLTIHQAIEKVREYGESERNEIYEDSDIKWTIENLIQRRELTTRRIQGRKLLGYIGHRRRIQRV